jgi:sugar-specific transcriptional regulator TrmB
MYEQSLTQAGLYLEQAQIYELLLKNGPQKAGKIAKNTGITRSLVYRILEELIKMKLVKKDAKSAKVAIFSPNHPMELQNLAEKKERQAKNAQMALESILPLLSSEFNLMTGKPNIQFFEGFEGLKKIYDDILKTNQDFLLIRAGEEPIFLTEVVPKLINTFIKKRVQQNIHVQSITPMDKITQERKEKDKALLAQRTLVDKEDYTAPVEINIYGNKVAFLSYAKELIGFIIESPQIAQSLKELFLLIKKGAKTSSDNQIENNITNQTSVQSTAQ